MDLLSFVIQPQVMVSLAVLIVLLWRISYGYKYGIVAELLEIAALAVGFCILNISAETMSKFLHGEKLSIVSAAIKIIVVLIIYRAIQGITNGVRGTRKIPLLGSADKLIGAFFGIVEIYIWLKLLNYIIGYDFVEAVTFTIASLPGLIGR